MNWTAVFTLITCKSVIIYYIFLKELFELGFALGYNWDQIYNAYLKKVDKNYKIQESFKK